MSRITDYLRERRIRRLCAECKSHFAAGRKAAARAALADMTAEIKRRSPQQVARMERAMGLRE